MARGLVVLPLMTRNISVPAYGIWVEIVALVGLLTPLATLGIDSAALRLWPARDRPGVARGFATMIATVAALATVIAAVVIALAAPIADRAWGRNGQDELLIVLAALTFATGVIERSAFLYFRASRNVRTYSILVLADAYLSALAIALLLRAGLGLVGVIAAGVLVQAVVGVAAIALTLRGTGLALPNRRDLTAHVAFGLPTVSAGAFLWVLNQSDRLVLAALRGSAEVAIYAVSYQWATYTIIFFNPLFLILIPRTSELWATSRERAIALLAETTRIGVLLTIPAIVGLTVLGPALLLNFTTDAYVAGVLVIPLVGTAYLLFMISAMSETVLNLNLRTRVLPVAYGGAAAFNLVATIALVAAIGYLGAAIATLLTFAVLLALTFGFARSHGPFPLPPDVPVRALVAAVVMGAVLWLVRPQGLGQIALAIPAGAVIYVAALLVTQGTNRAELRSWVRVALRAIGR